MADLRDLRPESYESSRRRFRADLDSVRDRWPRARLHSASLIDQEDLTTDWIRADAERQAQLVILSCGEHGIEDYVGSAVMQLFVREFVQRLNPLDTGIVLVHPINPWGMLHGRRANAAGVDVNRNFLWNPTETLPPQRVFDQSLNPEYGRLSFLHPSRPVPSRWLSNLTFAAGLLSRIRHADVGGPTTAGD